MNKYNYYFQKINKDGSLEDVIDIEEFFENSSVRYVVGSEDRGKPKNIYTEKYPEGNKDRVYIPDIVYHESTTIVITILFYGENRRSVFNDFCDYIENNKFKFSETFRNRETVLYFNDEIKLTKDNDVSIGHNPYIVYDFKFSNEYGKTNKRI